MQKASIKITFKNGSKINMYLEALFLLIYVCVLFVGIWKYGV